MTEVQLVASTSSFGARPVDSRNLIFAGKVTDPRSGEPLRDRLIMANAALSAIAASGCLIVVRVG